MGRMLLSELAPLVNAQQGVIYQMQSEEVGELGLLSAYADSLGRRPSFKFED